MQVYKYITETTLKQYKSLKKFPILIGVHLCIILYHQTMLYVIKYEIFIAFFSLFSGTTINGEEGPTIMIFKGIKE